MFQWFILPKPTIAFDGIYLLSVNHASGETLHLRNLESITDCFDNQSGSPSLHFILKESANEDVLASSDGGCFSFPILQDCNVVTSVIPIEITLPLEATPAFQSIPADCSATTKH
jgi:hypothetical protein